MLKNQAQHPSKRHATAHICNPLQTRPSVIVEFAGFGFVELRDEPAVYAMALETIDLLNFIDFIGDVLTTDALKNEKRLQAITLISTAMPRSLAGTALQSLLLSLLDAADHFGDAPLQRLQVHARGISGRFATEIFLLRDRMDTEKKLYVLEFVEIACLVRCVVIAIDQGWMQQSRRIKGRLL
jgi:hypothetical protein